MIRAKLDHRFGKLKVALEGSYRAADDWKVTGTLELGGVLRLIPFGVPGKPVSLTWGPSSTAG